MTILYKKTDMTRKDRVKLIMHSKALLETTKEYLDKLEYHRKEIEQYTRLDTYDLLKAIDGLIQQLELIISSTLYEMYKKGELQLITGDTGNEHSE